VIDILGLDFFWYGGVGDEGRKRGGLYELCYIECAFY
jgi:hypothetical protein